MLQQEAPQLTVVIGAALTYFKPTLPAIDLLAEQKEADEMRSKDPMRRAYGLAASLLGIMIVWLGYVLFDSQQVGSRINKLNAEMAALQTRFSGADADAKKAAEAETMLRGLESLASNRMLWAPALNALQFAVVDNMQVIRIQIAQQYSQTKGTPAVTNQTTKSVTRAIPDETTELTIMTIQAKSSAKPSAAESFMEALAESPWFKANLRSQSPIRLKENQAAQIDAADPNKMSILFTVECYAERKL